MGTKQITYLFFGAGLLLLVWLSYAINQRLRERDMLHERVRLSYRLLDVIGELEGLLKDVEVAHYAWVQTSDTLYLKSYNSAVNALIKAQFKLSDNTLGDSELQAYIEDVNIQLKHDLNGVFSHKDDTGRVLRPINLVVYQTERAARAVHRIKDMVGYLKSVTIRQIGQLEALLQQQAKHAGYQTNSIVGVLAIMLIYGFFILQWRRNQVQKLTRNLSVHNQELSAKTEVLQELNRRLSHKNSAMEEFTRIVSHNLRAPAATLMSLAQVMAISSDAEEIKEYGRLTKKVAANLNNSFEELMTVMQAGSETQTLEQVSFEDTLERVMLNTATQINETQAKVETDFSIVPQILYSRLYLESIIQNLLTNAIKYRHPNRNPVIKLSTYLKNQRVHLSVKDNGLGIDLKQYGDKLFGLYQTFHGSQQSRGVGLYLTRSHVRAQGGDIMVQSTPDMGTEFIIMF